MVAALPRISSVVVAIDYSELAELALDATLVTASRLDDVVVHALAVAEREGPPLPEELTHDVKQQFLKEATMTLNAYVERVRGTERINVTPHVVFGDPKERILELARSVQAGLVVLGTHGRRGVERLLMGSVTESVIREAICPVLAIRNIEATAEATSDRWRSPKRIGVAIDFSLGSRRALNEAARFAALFGAELVVLHILEPARFVSADSLGYLGTIEAPIEDYTRDHARARLDAFCQASLGDGALKLRREVHEGIARDAILRAAREDDYHWLVIGTHGRRGLRRALLGSVAEGVMRECPCPLLAVHSEANEE